jgi:hypothetical protein
MVFAARNSLPRHDDALYKQVEDRWANRFSEDPGLVLDVRRAIAKLLSMRAVANKLSFHLCRDLFVAFKNLGFGNFLIEYDSTIMFAHLCLAAHRPEPCVTFLIELEKEMQEMKPAPT